MTTTDRDPTAEAYDILAESYAAALPDDSYEADLDRAMISDFADQVRSTSGRCVVDAGSGAGRLAPVLSARGLDYLGVDLSPVMVRTAGTLHPGHRFVVGALTDLPLPDDSVDGILGWYSIIHTAPDDLSTVIAECGRVLRAGGFLLLGLQAGSGSRKMQKAYGHDVDLMAHLHDPAAVGHELEAAGFGVEATLVRGPRIHETHPQAMLLARAAW